MFFLSRPDIFPKCDNLSCIWRRVLFIDNATQILIQLGLAVFEKLVVPLLLHLVFKIFDFDASGLYFVLPEHTLKKIVFLVHLFHCLIIQLPTLPQLLHPTQIFLPLTNTFLYSSRQCAFFFSFLFPSLTFPPTIPNSSVTTHAPAYNNLFIFVTSILFSKQLCRILFTISLPLPLTFLLSTALSVRILSSCFFKQTSLTFPNNLFSFTSKILTFPSSFTESTLAVLTQPLSIILISSIRLFSVSLHLYARVNSVSSP